MKINLAIVPLLVALLIPMSAVGAPADRDDSFGSNGVAAVEGSAGLQFSSQAPPKLAVGPKGEIFVLFANTAPCAEFSGCSIEWTVARFSPDGVRDSGFNAHFTVKGNEYEPGDLAVGPDGKPTIAVLDQGRVVVARFDTAGNFETTLGAADSNPLFGSTYEPPVLAVQADGKAVVAVGHAFDLRVVRYLPSGERDPGFGSGGESALTLSTRSRPAGVLLGADGSISLAAPQCCGGSAPFGEGIGFARFLASGQPDTGLSGGGQFFLPTPGAQANVEAAVLAPDGGAYIVFEVNTGPTATVGSVVKLRPDGSVDAGFGRNGYSRFPMMSVNDLAVDGKGRLVAGGWNGGAAAFRMRPGGGPDRTFAGGAAVRVPSTGPASVALQNKGRIVVLAEPCCGPKTATLYRLVGGTDRSRCMGHEATIVGTAKPDEIVGTRHRDVIVSLGGADKVRGLGGPDVICGGKGADKLLGGAGRDTVRQ